MREGEGGDGGYNRMQAVLARPEKELRIFMHMSPEYQLK